ncbi:IS66 family insertion sequence element accessory protein TnpB [Salinibius halmophilus]|uniref:IS66 family insertion sequence element accessory protein TnpB n=1 Tax=Salinibius halmophilus TaxID=1853216 RepID=UPI000E66EE92|nr:IS66 family insertion sequence element accessory protein TnpB [Salinibius halmophilus]
MFSPSPAASIWLYTQPADMRKSYRGLLGLIKQQMNESPQQGYFVFINRNKTQMKILYFEPTGYCIWCKRLAQGQFNYAQSTSGKQRLSALDLQHILAGVKIEKYRQFKRYKTPNISPS